MRAAAIAAAANLLYTLIIWYIKSSYLKNYFENYSYGLGPVVSPGCREYPAVLVVTVVLPEGDV
jgi:hypothetical protein